MLRMALLDFPDKALKVQGVVLGKDNAKRLQIIRKLFASAAGLQALRRASLCLQLTGGVEAVLAAKPCSDHPPPVVGVANGVVHELVATRLSRLLGALPNDPVLDLGSATGGLLATAVDLLLRLDAMRSYPLLIARLCRKWNSTTFLRQCQLFLGEPADALDVGFPLQLHKIARPKAMTCKESAGSAPTPSRRSSRRCHVPSS